MYDPIHRCDAKSNYYHSAVAMAKGREALRDLLPLLETYLGNPNKYCWDRISAFWSFNRDTLITVDLGVHTDGVWGKYLNGRTQAEYDEDQGMILLHLTMLEECILNVLNPGRNK